MNYNNSVAIVGTSKHLTHAESETASQVIWQKLVKIDAETEMLPIVVTGGASGIDELAQNTARAYGANLKIFPPKENTWDSFRERNKQIAEYCNELLCISTKRVITQFCYHHYPAESHQKTAGCWTLNYAKSLGKKTELKLV